jgi:hypothetical protein
MNEIVLRSLQVTVTSISSLLWLLPAEALVIKDAGSKVYDSVANIGYGLGSPLSQYTGLIWHEDDTDSIPVPTGDNIIVNNKVPSTVQQGANMNPRLQMFVEQSNRELTNDLQTNDPKNMPTLLPKAIAKGTKYNSYYLFLDGIGLASNNSNFSPWGNSYRVNAFATIIFEESIFGIIGNKFLLKDTNQILGNSNIQYESRTGFAGLESNDTVVIEDNGTCIACVLKINFLTHDTMDPVRIITAPISQAEPVPEPMTILGSLVALCFGSIFKKHNQKA